MASTRRVQAHKGKRVATEVGDDNLLASLSHSGSSDDAAMRAAVEEQMKASWEKRRKEKEQKFLQTVEKEIQKIIASGSTKIAGMMQNMDNVYSNATLDYAASEDVIRGLWLRIEQEQRTVQNVVEECLRREIECVKDTENGQIQGMAQAKEAYEDSQTIISSLRSSKD